MALGSWNDTLFIVVEVVGFVSDALPCTMLLLSDPAEDIFVVEFLNTP